MVTLNASVVNVMKNENFMLLAFIKRIILEKITL